MPSKMKESRRISSWMRIWKRAKHWKMRNGMRVKWKYFYLDCRVEESQALGDVLQDESERKAFLPGWQCGRRLEIRRFITGWEWRGSIPIWMTVWKRARNYEMPNRMRVKGKYSYLDDSMKEGQALWDAQQDESKVEENCPKWWHHCRTCKRASHAIIETG